MFTKRTGPSRLLAPIAGILVAVAPVAYPASTSPDDTHWRPQSSLASPDDTHWRLLADPDDTHW